MTTSLLPLLRPLTALNALLGQIGKVFATVCIIAMVLVILLQVFFRYALNNALAWPDEFARFLMLWMTGMMAPVAFRQGGFVAIDTIQHLLPRKPVSALAVALLLISLMVLTVAAQLGWDHVNSGWLFASSSLKLPLTLIGMTDVKIKLAWMYLSLFIGAVLLLSVNVELLLRQWIVLLGDEKRLPPLTSATALRGD